MKNFLILGATAFCAFSQLDVHAADAVSFDASRHSVTFTAKAMGHDTSTKVEFLFVGPESDHCYEAMFQTEASIEDIVKAMEKAGIPRGRDYDRDSCRLWPVGESLAMEPAITNVLKDADGTSFPSVLFCGGLRDSSGFPVADTNATSALFALYNFPQSALQLDDSLDQSPTYGRFLPAAKFQEGERMSFTLSWNGRPTHAAVALPLAPGGLSDALKKLKDMSSGTELDVLCDFSGDLTLKEASEAAQALALIDSPRVKINGFKPGQFFYRAFLPLEKWRDRSERLAQPPEVHLKDDGTATIVEILEDWSDPDSLNPKLSVKEHQFRDYASASKKATEIGEKTYTILVYAPAGAKLGKLHEFKNLVTSPLILNWYVFSE